MDEPTADPTPTTVQPDGPGPTQDPGDAVFYGAILGAIAGTIAAGVFGLVIGNPGLEQVDHPVIFIGAVTVSALVLGMACSLAWGAVVAGVRRSAAAAHDDQMFIVAIIASAAAALLFMLVAPPLAGPIALLSIGLLTAYFAIALIVVGIGVMRRRDRGHRVWSNVEVSRTPARAKSEEADEPRGAPVDRPSFDAFIKQVATLSSDEARALAELARVPDWRRDPDVQDFVVRTVVGVLSGKGSQMGSKQIATENVARSDDAVREARRIVGQDAVEAAKKHAARTLAERRLSWRGMRFHRPLRVAMWGCLAAAGVLFVLRPTAGDQATVLLFMVLLSLAALSWLAGYLLPPDHRDLRSVVELAAVAHIAGPDLGEEHFSQLAGGWYVVGQGRWSRGKRPYHLWGCFFVSVAAVVILGVVLELTGGGQ